MNRKENPISPKELKEKFGIQSLFDLSSFPFVKNKKSPIPYLFAKEKKVLPLEDKGDKVFVATCFPFDIASLEELQLYFGKPVQFFYASLEILESAIETCFHQKEASFQKPPKEKQKTKEGEGYDLLEQTSDHPVVRLLNTFLIEAIRQKASDIHFEPQEEGFLVRFRIDGILQIRASPSLEYQDAILTRIKVMAQLDIAERRLPQDGRMKLKMGGREIDFRVSTLPVIYGERIVLRILDKKNLELGLDHIGMREKMVEEVRKLLQVPEGIFLVTGPTGAGKTTTLYSILSEIEASSKNIMTIEDPVEYKLPSIAQISVNTKIDLTFSKGLRHILRQDPDMILVGEIRDPETAKIAVQASLTGHLVFATIHTNDAPSAIPRLVDMGIESYLIASSLVGVLAQRLVRKICPFCKTSYEPCKEEKEELLFTKKGKFYRGEGCEACFFTGYQGRTGIYELMLVNESVKQQMMQSSDSSSLKKVAAFSSLREQGLQKILAGETTSSEVIRVTSK